MAKSPQISKNKQPGVAVLLSAAVLVQLLFYLQWPLVASALFAIFCVFCARKHPSENGVKRTLPADYSDTFLALGLWICAIVLRLYRLDAFHNINDLVARFSYAALQISRGHAVFPCIQPFEYDESLVSWVFAPFFRLMGHRWLTIKTVSAILSTLLVPVSYGWLRRSQSRQTSFLAAAFIVLSGYFQFCDPLISMSRFTLITIIVLGLLICLDKLFASKGSAAWILPAGVLGACALYIHSTGRVVLPLILWIGLKQSFLNPTSRRRRIIIRMAAAILLILVLFSPFIIFTVHDPAYFYFKKRQIFGMHEAYPFSWNGLLTNAFTVFSNFNYRAVLHMHFKDTYPLLKPITGTGAIGFVWLLILHRKQRFLTGLPAALCISLLALIAVTPGHWRGLYFSLPVAFLTLGAGVFYSRVIDDVFERATALPRFSKRLRIIQGAAAMAFVLMIAWARIPTFYAGPFSPPRKDMVTLLYEDMADEPDVPHYFSSGIPEMKPGYAIYEFLGSAWFSEYSVVDFDPLRIRVSDTKSKTLSLDLLNVPEVRFVLKSDEVRRLEDIYRVFHGYRLVHLNRSGQKLVVVQGE